jgi:hypothetical protein
LARRYEGEQDFYVLGARKTRWGTDDDTGDAMRKFPIYAGLAALALAVPVQAGAKSGTPKEHKSAKVGKCQPRAVGYNARGTFVSSSLTQTAGAATPELGDDRYSGSVTVNVAKANHKAPTADQMFTLDNAKVKFADADDNGVADVPVAGDRVKLHGKITRLKRKCDQTGFTPQVTVRKVQFKAPKPATP